MAVMRINKDVDDDAGADVGGGDDVDDNGNANDDTDDAADYCYEGYTPTPPGSQRHAS